MNNSLILTDEELATIQTALLLTITGHEKYLQTHGADSLDHLSQMVIQKSKELYARFNLEYFGK